MDRRISGRGNQKTRPTLLGNKGIRSPLSLGARPDVAKVRSG